MSFSYDGIPSDLVSEGKEGSRSLITSESAIKNPQSKVFTYHLSGDVDTITTTDVNGIITVESYTWDASGNPLTYLCVKQ